MTRHSSALLALTIACALLALQSYLLAPWVLDDAFIFFRYAENWAAGHGPVFNAGEVPVEGYTSFLWLAILTSGAALGVDLEVWAQVAGHGVVVVALLLMSQSWRFIEGFTTRESAVATLLLGTCSAFTPWARAGMETGLQALLALSLVLWCARLKRGDASMGAFVGAGLLCAALVMNRPDGALIVLVLGLDAVVFRRRLGAARVATTAVVFMFVFGVYFLWRVGYYGQPFPNTFYAKVGSTPAQLVRGVDYVWRSLATLWPFVLLACFAPRRLPGSWWALIAAHTVYVIVVGGDVMPAQRFFTALVPVLCLVAAPSCSSPRLFGRVGFVVAAGYGLTWGFIGIRPTIEADVVVHNGRQVGEWLRRNAPERSVVATNTAGSVVYCSKLRAIDMLGLNDRHIAHVEMPNMGEGHAGHEKGDGAYVLARRPEFLHLGTSYGWYPFEISPQPPFPGGKQIAASPEFRANYEFLAPEADIVLGTLRPGRFGIWVRKDIYEKVKDGR